MLVSSGIEIVKRIDFILSNQNKYRSDLKEIGIEPTKITHWLKRDTVPKIDDLYNIANFLGVSAFWLAFGIEEEKNEAKEKLNAKIKLLTPANLDIVEILIDGLLNKQKKEP